MFGIHLSLVLTFVGAAEKSAYPQQLPVCCQHTIKPLSQSPDGELFFNKLLVQAF